MKGSFNDIVGSSTVTLVDFTAEWCGPCKTMAPVLKELAGEIGDKARIIKIDVDKNPQVASKFNIRGVPTFMLFKNGEVVWQTSGAVPGYQLKEAIEQHA